MENRENDYQEVDLIYLSKKIKDLFNSMILSFFRAFRFILKMKYILVLLVVLGVGLGFLYEKYNDIEYQTKLIVVPNFRSVDYLYQEVDNFGLNIENNFSGNEYLVDFVELKVEPIVDLNILKDNPDFFKTIKENNEDIERLFESGNFKKLNNYYLITLTTKSNKNTDKIVNLFLENLNQSNYFKDKLVIGVKSLNERKAQLQKSIAQVNLFLDKLGTEEVKTTNDVSINSYDKLTDLINLKNYYIDEIARTETKLMESSSMVYPIKITYNMPIYFPIYKRAISIIPIALVLLFLGGCYIRHFYLKYENRLNRNEQ